MKNDLDKIKLVDSTLYEYALAHMSVDVDLYKEVRLQEFFSSETYYSINSRELSLYKHRKHQVILSDFLKLKNLQITKESYGFTLQNPPIMIDCEIDVNKNVKIYKRGIAYATNDNYKICIEIDYSHNGTYSYIIHTNKKDDTILVDWDSYATQNNIFKGKKISFTGKFLDLADISWDDVVLKDGVKETVIANVDQMFKLRDKFKKYGISVKRGIVLYGDPGTGKTKICKCLAKDAEYSVLYALPSDFQNTTSIKNICDMAKDLAPCLLVLEDIDWIAQDRSVSGPFVMELMNRIDGIESFGDVITLATTNCLDELENAIKNRPGRFDRLIKIDLPDKKSIKKMIKRFTQNYNVSDDVEIDILASCCENLSGAHIHDLCMTAAVNAVKSESIEGEKLLLKKMHFEEAIKEIKNKNYSSYLQMQSKGKNVGFLNENSRWSVDEYLNNCQNEE